MASDGPDRGVLIEATGIGVSFGRHGVLRDVGLLVREGEIVSLIGPNGAGKTTLARVILGLQEPDAGHVRRRPGLRIGYMPQTFAVDETLPLTVGGFLALAAPVPDAEKHRALDEVGAGHVMAGQMHELSGGELRRVLLARALLRNPDLLVLDEPVQGVDVIGQTDLYRLITGVRDRRRCGVLLVSHDLHVVMAETDKVVCLNHHVCCSGHPEAVSRHPEYLALFGPQAAGGIAVYTHHHDHVHDPDGEVMPLLPEGTPGAPGAPGSAEAKGRHGGRS